MLPTCLCIPLSGQRLMKYEQCRGCVLLLVVHSTLDLFKKFNKIFHFARVIVQLFSIPSIYTLGGVTYVFPIESSSTDDTLCSGVVTARFRPNCFRALQLCFYTIPSVTVMPEKENIM